MNKLRVAVLRGGPSSEYEVSLKTGGTVLQHLSDKYQPIDIFISKDGMWHHNGAERDPERVLKHADVVFNALHGEYGEDGKVQKILDHFGIPYTGSGAMASAVGMNKVLTKKAFEQHGIKTPYFTTVKDTDDLQETQQKVFHHFLLPFIVKPATSGSSRGVTLVKSFNDLQQALATAFAYSSIAIIEEYIRGREATCGVIDHFRNEKVYTLLPIEIVHENKYGVHDYNAKYSGNGHIISPGNFSQQEKEEIQRLAKRAHEALGLRHYSRSDLIVTPRRGIYMLEVNTLPGLTSESLLPKSLESIGCKLADFFDHILTIALDGR